MHLQKTTSHIRTKFSRNSQKKLNCEGALIQFKQGIVDDDGMSHEGLVLKKLLQCQKFLLC
jgi:hypothetical protein